MQKEFSINFIAIVLIFIIASTTNAITFSHYKNIDNNHKPTTPQTIFATIDTPSESNGENFAIIEDKTQKSIEEDNESISNQDIQTTTETDFENKDLVFRAETIMRIVKDAPSNKYFDVSSFFSEGDVFKLKYVKKDMREQLNNSMIALEKIITSQAETFDTIEDFSFNLTNQFKILFEEFDTCVALCLD